jgi:membrane protein implicated in regulation of membrane protease activity
MPEFVTLNCIYGTLLLIGVGYALFIVITGGLSDIDMPDVDIDVPQIDLPGDVDIPGADIHLGGPDVAVGGLDAPDVSVSPLSPITIASFITTFGGLGIICTQFFDCKPEWSLVIATVGGLAASGLMFLFYSRFLIGSQGSSELRRGELIGLQGEVTVPISETSAGKVTYVTKSGRMSSMARSMDGSAIPRGQFVRIVRTIGPQVLVEPLSLDSLEG